MNGVRRKAGMTLYQALCRNYGNRSSQCQERNTNNRNYEYESIDVRNRGRAVRSSEEAFVMNVERRGSVGQSASQPNSKQEEAAGEQTKPFQVSKLHVVEAYRRVRANAGAAGVDNQTLKDFEQDLKGNLHKIWNRLSSGSWMPPPVRAVEIPKKDGSKRLLGIPTVSDRIAQMTVLNINIFLCNIKHVLLLTFLFNFSAIVLFLILCFIPYTSASEDVLLTKYGYGSLIWNGEKHDVPAIWQYPINLDYSSNKIFNNYKLSDIQNEFNKSKHKLDARLKVSQKDDNLLAIVTFYNRSIHSFYIYRNRLPANLYFYPLCGDAFSINADSIHLDYLGRRCQFDDWEEKKSWRKIRVGETYDFTVKLNDTYAFPPGIRRYNIGTLEHWNIL